MSEYVRLEVADGIGTIRVDKPRMNPLDASVQDAIAAYAVEADARDDIRAVIVYGGEQVFAAGADVKEMSRMSYPDMVCRAKHVGGFTTAVARIGKPTVAAIEGYALGAGCELALACDFRVAAQNAVLGQPEVLLGLMPGAGGTQRLPRLIGPAKAKDMIFTGRQVDAQEALQMGLVDEISAPGQAWVAARERMRRFVGGPAMAVRHAKEAVDRGLETDVETGTAIEAMLFAGVFATEDARAGMASFVEKGPGKAVFEGR
ncbi:short chain enoyl-CoA hydratase [Austwickia chelonae]|uniref:enoyl-CoA hydratase n=1 Tax=Austwickia chelonae NBRC 105200 TaxID=1184607 RepID=K6W4C3_9MICO|nr:enoyl-CoA hydratase-related protein [Austwickia chelonae]GAB76652.1 putative enoyl-CoA hydratase [Austwickia chelonae NBRC 105200]SEW28732.1 short chain enoyl-CoA hydratase [Austwickia chelonae]